MIASSFFFLGRGIIKVGEYQSEREQRDRRERERRVILVRHKWLLEWADVTSA